MEALENDKIINNNKSEIVYTVSQVAKLLHVNKNYVYTLINKGYLPVLKFKSYRVRRESLEYFLEKYEGKDLSSI